MRTTVARWLRRAANRLDPRDARADRAMDLLDAVGWPEASLGGDGYIHFGPIRSGTGEFTVESWQYPNRSTP